MRSAVLVAVLVSFLPARAVAQDASALFERGVREFAQARFKESIRTLESARDTADDTQLLGRINLYLGLGHAVMGERARARTFFQTALRHDPTIKLDRAQFNEELVSLFEEVRRGLKGELAVTARPGSVLTVDGRDSRLPFRASMGVGKHRVEVRGPDGALLLSQVVTIAAGATITLHAAQASAARVEPPSGLGPAPRRRIWTWVVGGTGLALLAAGLGVYASAGPMTSDTASDGRPCVEGDQSKRSACGALLDSIHHREDIGYALIGVGAALAAGSVVLFFLEGRAPREARGDAVRLTPMLGSSTAGAAVVGRF